jgi:putative phage-type endonuclease
MAESSTTLRLPIGVEATSYDDEAAWLAGRRPTIGASEAPIILGLSRFKTPYQLWAEKIGVEPVNQGDKEIREWGLLLEEPIARRYARETERLVDAPPPRTVLTQVARPGASCTPDRFTQIEGVWAPLELKTAHFTMGKHWKEEPPLEYVVQVQHQMMIWGTEVASLAGLIGGSEFQWCDIAHDPEFIDMLYERIVAFLRLVETKEPPPLDHTKATREVIAKLYGRETGEVIALPGIAMDWDSELMGLKEQRKQIDEQIGLLENQIVQAIGGASAGVLPDGTVWSHKTQTRKEHVVKASEFKVLRRHGARGDR